MLSGRIVLEDFDGEAFRDRRTRELMRRIHAAPCQDEREALGAEVRITFDDGRTIARRIGAALGRGPDNPLPQDALTAKFANCAARVLPLPQVSRLRQLLQDLDEVPGLRAVTAAAAAP